MLEKYFVQQCDEIGLVILVIDGRVETQTDHPARFDQAVRRIDTLCYRWHTVFELAMADLDAVHRPF